MGSVAKKIQRYMEAEFNVLLCGRHGVGKTQMVVEEARRQGLRLKYYSAATLDPWADLVGIPIPMTDDARKAKFLIFVRPADIDAAEIVFFDELNRSHPKVQNAVLEMVQFKSINGVPLPNLKMVWAAINPPDDIYHVTELDPTLQGRFHLHLDVPAQPSVAFYTKKAQIPKNVAKALVSWWERDLDDNLKRLVSPRRLEYMGLAYTKGIELRDAVPSSLTVPLQHLYRRLNGDPALGFELTQQSLVNKQEEILAEMRDNPEAMLAVGERLEAWPGLAPRCVRIFLALTSELQARLLRNHQIKTALVNLGRQNRHGQGDPRALADRLSAIGVSLR